MLERFGDLVTSLGHKQLFFIVNPGKDHWAVVKVDFQSRTYSYGDSLANICTKD